MSASKSDNVSACQQEVAEQSAGVAVAFSSGIRKIRYIHKFLDVDEVVSSFDAARRKLAVTCVVVWGRKQNSRSALRYAKDRELPVLYVEDGWIRSCSANAHSRVSYSLLVDDVGVYYDSTVPSALELYLNLPDEQFGSSCGDDQLRYAARCRKLLTDNDITKYNYCRTPDSSVLNSDSRPLVLVLDQTCDDASVRLGGMNAESFNALLDRAIAENPTSRVVVRTHPDVVAGRRKGYLQSRAIELGIEISAAADNPIPWLKKSAVVYVGTSQLGFEALLCGCVVKVGGQPFYAGWGLTVDLQPIARRVRRRTLDQLFHATHVEHARYCCPVTGERQTLHDCLLHVQLQKSYFKRNSGKRVCVGITPWKRRYIAQFMRSPDGATRFSRNVTLYPDETLVTWSFAGAEEETLDTDSTSNAGTHGRSRASFGTRIRVEDGFIRSTGLGSDFVAPASLVFDTDGLYFDANNASTLEKMLNEYECTDDELSRAKQLRASIVAKNLTKYNVDGSDEGSYAERVSGENQKKILVVGQVEGDQSILRGSRNIRSNSELLGAVRKRNPDAFICFKPHPDVVSGNRKGHVKNNLLKKNVDLVEIKRSFVNCLDWCDELHTMTSLSGFEALLREKAVVTYGMPFYAGWGMTHDSVECHRRTARRTIDELVVLSLIVYPHYLDMDSGEFISVEQLVKKFHNEHSVKKRAIASSWVQKVVNISNALSFSA